MHSPAPARPPAPHALRARAAVLAVLVLATGAAPACARTPAGPRAVVESGGRSHVVVVEVADDALRRERGLMYRQELPDDRGMLFVFDEEGEHSFWMKNTVIPLDIIFIDAQGRVTGVVERARPLDLSPRSGGPSKWVLEVAGGWAAARGVQTGDRVRLEGIPAASAR
jgi:uncharacterized membrane protein (UPF0127 family)